MLRKPPAPRKASDKCTGCPHLKYYRNDRAYPETEEWSCDHHLSADKKTCPVPDRTIEELRNNIVHTAKTSIICPLAGWPGTQCRSDCAWLLSIKDDSDYHGKHVCAIAALASKLTSSTHDTQNLSAIFFDFKKG